MPACASQQLQTAGGVFSCAQPQLVRISHLCQVLDFDSFNVQVRNETVSVKAIVHSAGQNSLCSPQPSVLHANVATASLG
jgi:hypothetical protein